MAGAFLAGPFLAGALLAVGFLVVGAVVAAVIVDAGFFAAVALEGFLLRAPAALVAGTAVVGKLWALHATGASLGPAVLLASTASEVAFWSAWVAGTVLLLSLGGQRVRRIAERTAQSGTRPLSSAGSNQDAVIMRGETTE